MQNIKAYFSHPRKIGLAITKRYLKWLPDKVYLQLLYRFETGKPLHLKHPKTFNEKLQWLKLYNRKPLYTDLVDKYNVKSFVVSIIGIEHVIPTLGIWETANQIDYDALPDSFVLKTTHGGGSNGIVICRDKSKFDTTEANKKLDSSLSQDIYNVYREWPYKNVKKRIIAEDLIKTTDGSDLRDYKFFCFNGEPKFFKVDFDRFTGHKANYYDLDWNLLTIGEVACPPDPSKTISAPPNFNKMVELVKLLCKDFQFIRVDMYNVDGKIYFGEMTFFPAAGMGNFIMEDDDLKIGNLLDLRQSYT